MQEKKEEAVEEKKEEVKEEKKEEEDKKKKNEEEEEKEKEIVLKVDMHCEACARKVARALKGFQGFFINLLLSFKFSNFFFFFFQMWSNALLSLRFVIVGVLLFKTSYLIFFFFLTFK